ncbi:nitroreductase family protein [Persicirhabdus sediminis]|uniref:Nitroreductase family protein n=1 Tax=Persicirhabdus sediminis TaxID=454144 RepID=A0A8J7MDU3_9BACT|nr:nitroreductase family protein [Persicirhabdus sediminis]MBK1791597.1 nitroreductase family protein [Persicirhabdus sediminis]
MKTIENIDTRRSIKHYDAEHVMPEADLAELIRLTKLAPSSFNMQNYRLLVVRDKDLRQQIRAAAWDQAQVTDASVLFIMCADLNAHNEDPAKYWGHAPQEVQDILGPMIQPFYDGNEQLIRDEAIRSSALAGMTLMLAARDLGYDSCPMIGFDGEAVAKLVNLPAEYIISFMIPVGKKSQEAWDRGARLADDEVVSYDTF